MQPDLTVSIICTDNRDPLRACLASLYETARHITTEVFVVDNASGDGTSEMVTREFPQVRLIRNEVRMGFASNNNQVLTRAAGRYVMLLNDDTLLLPGALDNLVQFMDAHPEAAAAGTRLLSPDRSLQLSVSDFPHPVLEAFQPLTERWRGTLRHPDVPIEVDWVCGASLLARCDVVGRVGLLDPAFDPIYSEETDWCYRIKAGGGRIFHVPQAEIVHFGGQTMGRIPRHRMELVWSHQALFFRKHYGAGAERLFRVCLSLASLLKLLGWTCALPIAQERARAEIPLHWHMIGKALSL